MPIKTKLPEKSIENESKKMNDIVQTNFSSLNDLTSLQRNFQEELQTTSHKTADGFLHKLYENAKHFAAKLEPYVMSTTGFLFGVALQANTISKQLVQEPQNGVAGLYVAAVAGVVDYLFCEAVLFMSGRQLMTTSYFSKAKQWISNKASKQELNG